MQLTSGPATALIALASAVGAAVAGFRAMRLAMPQLPRWVARAAFAIGGVLAGLVAAVIATVGSGNANSACTMHATGTAVAAESGRGVDSAIRHPSSARPVSLDVGGRDHPDNIVGGAMKPSEPQSTRDLLYATTGELASRRAGSVVPSLATTAVKRPASITGGRVAHCQPVAEPSPQ